MEFVVGFVAVVIFLVIVEVINRETRKSIREFKNFVDENKDFLHTSFGIFMCGIVGGFFAVMLLSQ